MRITSDPWGRRERCRAIAITFIVLAALLLLVAHRVNASAAADRLVREPGVVTNYTRYVGGYHWVAVRTDYGNYAAAPTLRRFWRGQRVVVTGRLDSDRLIANPQIR